MVHSTSHLITLHCLLRQSHQVYTPCITSPCALKRSLCSSTTGMTRIFKELSHFLFHKGSSKSHCNKNSQAWKRTTDPRLISPKHYTIQQRDFPPTVMLPESVPPLQSKLQWVKQTAFTHEQKQPDALVQLKQAHALGRASLQLRFSMRQIQNGSPHIFSAWWNCNIMLRSCDCNSEVAGSFCRWDAAVAPMSKVFKLNY